MRHWERAPLPRIAPRVGATRQPCRLRLTDGTHTAPHRLAPRPRHTRERPRQTARTRCAVPRSHRHARALRASVARRHRASCTGSIERSKPVVLRVLSVARARSCQLGSGWCVWRRAVARPTCAYHDPSIHSARRLLRDAGTPGGHCHAVGHNGRVRGRICCTPPRCSLVGAGAVTSPFAGALEPYCRGLHVHSRCGCECTCQVRPRASGGGADAEVTASRVGRSPRVKTSHYVAMPLEKKPPIKRCSANVSESGGGGLYQGPVLGPHPVNPSPTSTSSTSRQI